MIDGEVALENKLQELKNSTKKTARTDIPVPSTSENIISIRTFSEIDSVAKSLKSYIDLIEKDAQIQKIFAGTDMDVNSTMHIYLLKDIVSAYKELGHSFTLNTLEGQCLAVVEMMLGGIPVEYDIFHSMMTNSSPEFSEFKEATIRRLKNIDASSLKSGEKGYNIMNLVAHDRDLQKRFLILLYRYMSLVIKIDNVISDKETAWLNSITQERTIINDSPKKDAKTEKKEEKAVVMPTETKDPIAELNNLIGLASVKTEINNLSNLVKIQKMRESRGMKASNVSYFWRLGLIRMNVFH